MRKRTRLPKYRRHSTGQAFVEIDGRRRYLGIHGTDESKELYQRIIAELCTRPKAGLLCAKSPADRVDGITIVEVIAVYLEFARSYYTKNGRSTGTAERLRPVIRRLRELYGRSPAVEFGPTELKAFRQSMVDAGHSRTYVNMNVDRVRRMFRWAAAENLILVTVHQTLAAVPNLRKGRTEARETEPVGPVSDAAISAVLPFLTPVTANMVRFQRLTGCRPNEVRLIRPCDVDRSTDDVWLYVPAEHKTEHHGRRRVIVIGPKAQDVLRPYLLRSPESYCFSPKESRQKWLEGRRAARQTPPSQGNRPGLNRKRNPQRAPGDCYSKDAYRNAIARAAKKAGVEPWSPNRLRHSAATEIRKKYGLEASQVILGHSRADVTEIYAERDLALARRVMFEAGSGNVFDDASAEGTVRTMETVR